MHTGAFAAAGQRLADTDDSFSSAPRGILIGQTTQKDSGNTDPRNEIRTRATKFKITEKRAEFSVCAQNSDEAPIFCMALQKS